jgi:hypothetical protein
VERFGSEGAQDLPIVRGPFQNYLRLNTELHHCDQIRVVGGELLRSS